MDILGYDTKELESDMNVIKTGVYGEDVRGSIYGAFDFIKMVLCEAESAGLLSFLARDDAAEGRDMNMDYDESYTATRGMRVWIERLLGSRISTYKHMPGDYVSGQPGLLISISCGTNVKQFILYFGAGSNVICKFHTRVRNNNTWSGWTTVDLLNMSGGTTQNVVLG